MATDKPAAKKKLPYTEKDIRAVEDRLTDIISKFREIRRRMEDLQMDTVLWKFGTFKFLTGRLEKIQESLLGDFNVQVAEDKARRDREQIKADREKRNKKQN